MRTTVDGPLVRFEMTRVEVLDLWETLAPGYKVQEAHKAMAAAAKDQVSQFPGGLGGLYDDLGPIGGHHHHLPDAALYSLAEAVRGVVREMAGATVKVAS